MKTFSKFALYVILVLLTAIGYSCKEDDDDNNNGNDDKTSVEFEHGKHSYLIVKELKTWVAAAADAASQGGYLVEIDDQAEQDAVYQAIVNSGISSTYVKVNDGGGSAYIWIGATDRYGEGAWLWNGANKSGTLPMFWFGDNTGSAVAKAYVNWGGKAAGKFNEPDNFTDAQYSPKGQNAAAIGLAKWPAGSSSPLGVAGEWNDITESNKLYYVIEFDTTN